MRLLKILYYVALFSYFALSWWKVVPPGQLLWLLLSAIGVVVLLHIISYRKYGTVVRLDTKTDGVIVVAGMVLLLVVEYTVMS